MQVGNYKLVGIETCDSGAKYGATISLEVFESGFLSGTVVFDHWNGNEGVNELSLCGNYSGNNFSWNLNYGDSWYKYEGVWGESTSSGSFWEAQYKYKSEAPENRRGQFIHVIAKLD